ncbi:transposase [Bradyrhizobium cenepequi]|uniref:transposase n=1 Tax=Bradyrhizobium cenepequi TaxID=2821403 RepID=UPI001CE33054|nr:transposase [Bradyrhizobium cenepequi]MCA6111114.1 transposase [Bradyrhizobium cenepequi]
MRDTHGHHDEIFYVPAPTTTNVFLLRSMLIEYLLSLVAKYMVKRRGPSHQGWRIFLRNHAPGIAAMDLFVVPTIGFDLLYAFVIVRLDRRNLAWINVTKNPTAEWVARQITEAFPWDQAPKYLIRDRDRIYGTIVTRRLRAMGIRDKPTAPASRGRTALPNG